MENINKMFWRILFDTKNVALDSELFKSLHHIIFPCIESFDEFLHADTTEKMVSTAKMITSNILFTTSVSPTPAVFYGLIDAESNYPATSGNQFVSQDHMVHSVNVYLLGIYLFFNHQLLHDRMYDWFRREACGIKQDTKRQAILQFVDAWKIFALCHDIGYPFEKLIGLDGGANENAKELLELYRELGSELKYDRLVRSTAQLMFASDICRQSQDSLRDLVEGNGIKLSEHQWNGAQSKELNESGF